MREGKRVISVILAGGFGTRLSPLTDMKPKPLVKILDTTVLENVICAVKKTMAESIVVSTFYKTDMIVKKCREIDKNIVCKKEKIPLGTAGGVKYCCDGDFDAVLVVSGDGVFDFDLQKAIDFHFEEKNDVTIVTSCKEDPTEYGVVVADDEKNIIRFDEKPSWKRVRSSNVNTGIYILSKDVIDEIPEMRQYDFSKNLLPRLLKEGRRMKAFFADGFWCDIGTLQEYYTCNTLAARGKISCIRADGKEFEYLNESGIHSEKGVYVSKNCFVGKNVRINSGSVVCKNAKIGDNCDISFCIISENASIGNGCSICGAIIGENVSVGENCIIPEGVVVGDGSRIADGTVVEKNTHIAAERTVVGMGKNKMDFFVNDGIFACDGKMLFERGSEIKMLQCVSESLGIAFGKRDGETCSFAVMSDKQSRHFRNVFVSLLAFFGNRVFDGGEGGMTMCSFATRKLSASAGVFLSYESDRLCMILFSEDGKNIDEQTERKISKISSLLGESKDESDKEFKKNGEIVGFPSKEMYKTSLRVFLEGMLSGADISERKFCISRELKIENPCAAALCEILEGIGAQTVHAGNNDMMTLFVSEDGTSAKVRYKNTVIDHEHLCAIVLKNADILGIHGEMHNDNIPIVLKNIMKNADAKTPCDFSVFNDAAACILAFISAVCMRGEEVENLLSEIPSFEIYTDEYIADVNRGETMERLSRLYHDSKDDNGDGIRLQLAEGNVTVIPNRMKGFKIISEASSMEAAKELAVKIGKAIKN